LGNDVKREALIGNTFPVTLIRRDVGIRVVSVNNLREMLAGANIFSFWGHPATLVAAEQMLRVPLKPLEPRPALGLDAEKFPCLYGHSFRICFVCSPDCRLGYRPKIGEELLPDDILGWQTLRIEWI
jgi:hypothetical protein